MKPTKRFPLAIGAALTLAACTAMAAGPAANNEKVDQLTQRMDQLLQLVNQLNAEVQTLKAENQSLRKEQSQTQQGLQSTQAAQAQMGSQVAETSVAVEKVQAQVQAQPASHQLDNLSLWGYGEIYDMNPVHNSNLAQADLARAVFGIGYRFDDKTRFNSEFEVEHGVASASDVGEFEVEQFYIDHTINPSVSLQAGLFLIPTGFLNENHEPTHFYGVQRNFVETLIIPSTWREGGINLHGNTEDGLRWTVGLTTGQDISKWNFTPEFVPYQTALDLENNGYAPLQATHQELSLAKSKHLAQFVSLDYSGVPGLRVGGSVFTSNMGSTMAGLPDERGTLWETHARYSPGNWQLSALYAQGTISNTAAANSQFPGTANPIPSRFDGWFVEAGYKLWESGDYKLTPFARYEHYNMGAGYEGLAPGFGPRPTGLFPTSNTPGSFGTYPYAYDDVSTVGANFYLSSGVVFKVDYQHFKVNSNFSRIDFGLGLAFE